MAIEDTLLGLVGGFAVSIVTYYLSTKIKGKAVRKEELRKNIRKFFPILRELSDDLSYALSMRMRNNIKGTQLKELLEKIIVKLDSFLETYSELRNAGLEPELESSDKRMLNELKGLYTLRKVDAQDTLLNKLDVYYSKVLVCLNLVESYLKK